jgi:dolichyl-phosphate-mannose--protein O-mannosyl transferase
MHYYFECIPFACIALAYLGWRMWTSESGSFATRRLRRVFVAGYAAVLAGWFLFYYPLLSAYPVPNGTTVSTCGWAAPGSDKQK